MSTKFLSPGWRMPRNANQSKQSNYSMDFNTNESIAVNGTSLQFSGSTSFSAWFKMDGSVSTTTRDIITKGIEPSSSFIIRVQKLSNIYKIRFQIQVSGGAYVSIWSSTSPTVTADVWHHVVGVFDVANNQLKLYYDGTEVSGSPVSLSGATELQNTNDNLLIGIFKTNVYDFYGQIDEVSIFDYALSSSQVTTLYGTGSAIGNPMALPSTPIAYYPLSTSAWNGEYLAENNAIGDYVFDFTSGNSITTAFTPPTSNSTRSISIWFNPDNSILKNMCGYGSAVANQGFDIVNYTSNTVGVHLYSTAVLASGTYNANEWNHYVVTYDGTTLKGYLNGNPVGTSTNTVNTGSTTFKIAAGAYSSADSYDGQLSNIQVWSSELLATEVETLYNYGSPIQTLASIPQNSNLKAWYKLDASEVYNSTTTEWSIDNNQNPSAYPSGLKCTSSNYLRLNAGYETPQILSDIPNKLSLSFWINAPSGQGSNMYFFSRSSNQIIINSQANNNLRYSIYPGTGAVTGSSILDGSWHHCVMVYDFSNTSLACYEDGMLIEKVTNASVLASRRTAMILCTFGSGAGNSLAATVSNFCIWEDALSDGGVSAGQVAGGDVATLFNNGTPLQEMSSGPKYSTLRAWWKFDNLTSGLLDNKNSFNASAQLVSGQTTPVAEYAGFVNTLAGDSSGMTQANLVQSNLQTVAPYSKYAMKLDDATLSDYINVPNNSTLQITGNLTLSSWVRIDGSYVSNGHLIAKADSYVLKSHQGSLSNVPRFQVNDGTFINLEGPSALSLDTWHHITGVREGNSLKLYVNGSLVASSTPTIGNLSVNNNDIQFNAYTSNFSSDITLSNNAIWNVALNASEIREIYNEGLPSNLNTFSGTAPVSWWQLGENSSFDGSNWKYADEMSAGNNADSVNTAETALTNGVGTTANGVSSGMSEGNLVGDAPYSTANAISSNMAVTARVTGSGNTP